MASPEPGRRWRPGGSTRHASRVRRRHSGLKVTWSLVDTALGLAVLSETHKICGYSVSQKAAGYTLTASNETKHRNHGSEPVGSKK